MDDPVVLDDVRIDDLIAACSSLGEVDVNDGVYMKDRDCKACLKEIIRYLNNDNKQHEVRCNLGSLNIVKSDLIPLMVQYCDFNDGDPDLFNLILRLLTNLTSSLLLLYENQEIPNDQESMKIYNNLLKGLHGYKEAFANNPTIWETLNTHLRHTEEEFPFERLLILIRNILHIPVDTSADLGIHNEYDAHDMCLNWMEKSGMMRTLIEVASETQRGTEYCFHLMEIIYLMLREKNPITIASAKLNNNKRKLDDDDPDKKKLAELRERDRSSKASRHIAPRFRSAIYVAEKYASLSDAPIVVRQLPTVQCPISSIVERGKTELRKNKIKKPFNSERSSVVISDRDTRPTKIAYSLKVFCKQFTEKVYANYMQQIKHNLIQKKAAENDESYYLWGIQFFTAFNRHLCMTIDNISETLSSSTLHFIQVLINDYQDKLKVEKKRNKIELISKRLHLAVRAYREILRLIESIGVDSEFHETVEKIKKKIFTEVEYNNMLLSLFQQYDESKHCKEYVRDLIITTEVFLDLGTRSLTMSQYFNSDVVRAHAYVLKDHKANDSNINMSIIKYFERLAYDNHMEVMLMQASLFVTLLEIIDDKYTPNHERFLKLAKHLMSAFTKLVVIDEKRWMFQELLFWKTYNDVLEIEEDKQAEEITAKVVDDDQPAKDSGNTGEEGEMNDEAPEEGLEDQVFDQGGLSPLSQISGVDD